MRASDTSGTSAGSSVVVRRTSPHSGHDRVAPHAYCIALRADGIALRTDGIALHADGIALHTDGVALHADGIALHTDGIALHADGIALRADGIALRADGVALCKDGVALRADCVALCAVSVALNADGATLRGKEAPSRLPRVKPLSSSGFRSFLGSSSIFKPADCGDHVIIKDAVVPFPESKPRQVGEPAVRHDDCAAQLDRA